MAPENRLGPVPAAIADEGRTALVDLSEIGFELDEAHLPLVVGGRPPESSACTEGGCEDCD
ncbi:hypothetical protein DCC79_14080 [bacterium]|nr:MAG: hypothetical protein DCC79_14080 [bacterium]